MDSAPERGAFARDRQLIRHRYLELLRDNGSPLTGPAVIDQVLSQLDSILDSAYAATALISADESAGNQLALSATIGRDRAAAGVHPSLSMHAATLVFEAALPVLSATLAEAGRDEPAVAASFALNRAIMDRIAMAATLYVGFLLEKIHRANSDERRRLTRDLHDVVAPSVAVGLQHLDLYEIYSEIDPARAGAKIIDARQSLHDALSAMRTLSAESRESVARGGLRYAIAAVLERSAPGVETFLNVSGDLAVIPSIYCEEIFLLVREAVRNAFNHARPSRVTVTLTVSEQDLAVYVVDDGIGFEVTGATLAATEDSLGLVSMAERAQLLGGRLTVVSGPGEGTTVTARIPRRPTPPAAATESDRRASAS